MKFIADSMLGRLAKWLRLLGLDTLYYPDIEDSLLLRIAREQDRTILTRDTRLVRVKGIGNYLLLEDNDPFKQLSKVITAYELIPQPVIRCSICNEIPVEINREKARPHVPEYIYKTSSSFKQCLTCGKFYWKGTHQQNWQKKLSELLHHS